MSSPDAARVPLHDASNMSEARTPAPALGQLCVRDYMHPGVLTCSPDDALQAVAGIMANHRVHAVVITSPDGGRPLGVVSDLDVIAAVAGRSQCTARQAGATEPLSVSADAPLEVAAQLMNEHAVSHLVVIDADAGYPVAVLSSLDVAAAYAES
jgi:CBS domain-containing protein